MALSLQKLEASVLSILKDLIGWMRKFGITRVECNWIEGE